MEFTVLGPVGARLHGREVDLPAPKLRTVLAALLLARGRTVADAVLAELLWGGRAPRTVSAQLYTYVSRLRTRLGQPVRIDREAGGYRLRIVDGRLDIDEFTRLAARGRNDLRIGWPEAGAWSLRAALALWREPALGGVTVQLRQAELPWLTEARMAALEDRIDADLALGEHRELVPELTELVTGHPLRERLRAQWMTALYRCGRQADALAAYRAGRDLLTREAGLEPGPILRATHLAALNGTL